MRDVQDEIGRNGTPSGPPTPPKERGEMVQ